MILVVKNGFRNDHGNLLRYLDYIRGFSFVDDISVFPYTSYEALTRMNNIALFIQEKIANIIPSIFPFHLTELEEDSIEMEEYDILCSDIKKLNAPNIPTFMVNLLKIGNTEAYNLHVSVVKQIFSVIGTRMYSVGKPEADYWDEISIVKYQSRTKLCEMLSSKEFQDDLSNSVKGLADARMYSTVQII